MIIDHKIIKFYNKIIYLFKVIKIIIYHKILKKISNKKNQINKIHNQQQYSIMNRNNKLN